MKPEEAKKLGALTCTLTLTTDALFGLGFKANFITYQLYCLEQAISPFLWH